MNEIEFSAAFENLNMCQRYIIERFKFYFKLNKSFDYEFDDILGYYINPDCIVFTLRPDSEVIDGIYYNIHTALIPMKYFTKSLDELTQEYEKERAIKLKQMNDDFLDAVKAIKKKYG